LICGEEDEVRLSGVFDIPDLRRVAQFLTREVMRRLAARRERSIRKEEGGD